MIRFEVTGETPEQFARNALQAWGVLAAGLQQILALASTDQTAMEPGAPATIPLAAGCVASASIASAAKIKPEEINDRLAVVVNAHGTVIGRRLLASVGAKKVTEIDTDEKRTAFMRASEEYLTPPDMNDDIPF